MNQELRPEPEATRSIELSIEIDAPPETVWNAISEAEELVRWFPPDARVEPGVGGRVWVSWGEGMDWSSRIDVWEPNERLRTVDELPPEAPRGAQVALEYRIETRGGGTVLRLVHSGFSASADWDQYYDSMVAGWTYFLRNLKHYIERHLGVPRSLIKWRRPMTPPVADVWRMLADPAGLGFADARPGERWSKSLLLDVPSGGEVWMVRPPYNFACTIESLNDAILFIEMEPGGQTWHCGVWLSTYGLPPQQVEAVREKLDARLTAILGPALQDGTS